MRHPGPGMKARSLASITATCLALLCASGIYAAQEGTQAPNISLSDLSGSAVTLEQLRGKVVLLVFWAPWCVSCRDELPRIDMMFKKHHSKGFEVIGISEDAADAVVANFLRKVPLSFPIVIDSGNSVAESYRLASLPTGYLIDRNGIIRHSYRGFAHALLQRYEIDVTELLEQHNP